MKRARAALLSACAAVLAVAGAPATADGFMGKVLAGDRENGTAENPAPSTRAEMFGPFTRPYHDRFRPNPFSRAFVRHIVHHQYGRTYAQKHPDEDFAETFAVWLTPRSGWRRHYRNWPALAGKRGVPDPDRTLGATPAVWQTWKEVHETYLAGGAAPERTPARHTPTSEHLPKDTQQTQIALAFPGAAFGDPDYYAARGAVGVLSGGMGARLFTEVREKRGLCYSVYATHDTVKDRGAVIGYAGTRADRAQQTLDVMIGEFRRLKDGVTADEVDRVKASLKTSLVMQQESTAARAGSIGQRRILRKSGSSMRGLIPECPDSSLSSSAERSISGVQGGDPSLSSG